MTAAARPGPGCCGESGPRRWWGLLLVAAAGPWLGSCSDPRRLQPATLVVRPASASLGVLGPGQKGRTVAAISNPGRFPAVVDRVATSCPCLTARLRGGSIGPGASSELIIEFDPADEPDFRGRLSVAVTGFEGDREIFSTSVEVAVEDPPAGPRTARAASSTAPAEEHAP